MAEKNFGKELWLEDPADGTLKKVADLLSLKVPGYSRGTIDTTTHDNVDGVMTFIGEGVMDPGEVSATIHWVPGSTNEGLILTRLASGDARPFKAIVNGVGGKQQITGSVIVTGYEPDDAPVEGKQTATIGMKASGQLLYAVVP